MSTCSASGTPHPAFTAAAESLQNEPHFKSSAAESFRAELQILLAEIKRLGLQQERLYQDVAAVNLLGSAKVPSKSADLKKNGCSIGPNCPGPILTVPFGRQWTCGSSDWSEGTTETPVRNVVSGEIRPAVVV